MEPVKLLVENNYTAIHPTRISRTFETQLKQEFSISWESWVKDFRSGRTMPSIRTMTLYKKGGIVPTGYLDSLKDFFERRGSEVTIEDLRVKPARVDIPQIPEVIAKLRYYQMDAFKAAYKYQRGIFKLPTGSGKTLTAQAIVSAAGSKALIIVPNLELLYQTEKSFADVFGKQRIGIVGAGDYITHKPITIATVQSLWSRFGTVEFSKDFDRVGTLIIDESHHLSVANLNKKENTWYKIAQRIPAYWRFGMTATPGKETDASFRMLQAATYKVIHTVTTKELVDAGFLSVPKIVFYRIAHSAYYKWQVAKEQGIGLNSARNELIRDKALELAVQGKKVLIVVDRVEKHGKVLYELIGSKYSSFIHGSSDKDKRTKAKKEFKSGDTPILIGTVFGEGVDFPYMDCVIIAAGGKSDKQTIQRLGRVLRKADGKVVGMCIDFMDLDRGKGFLKKHSEARYNTYLEQGFDVEVR